jgi:hypothetical protein
VRRGLEEDASPAADAEPRGQDGNTRADLPRAVNRNGAGPAPAVRARWGDQELDPNDHPGEAPGARGASLAGRQERRKGSVVSLPEGPG